MIWGFLTEAALIHPCELLVWFAQRQTARLRPWGPRARGVEVAWSELGWARACREGAGLRSAGFEFPASGEVGGRTRLEGEPFEDLWREEREEMVLSQKPGLMVPQV